MDAYRLVRGGLIRLLEWALVVMVITITLNVLWGVTSRSLGELAKYLASEADGRTWIFAAGGWLPKGQAVYTDELARVLLVWISMLGGALAFARKAHLGVDYFVSKMHPDARKTLAVVVQCVTIAFAVVALMIGGFALAQGQWTQKLPTMPWLTKGMVYAAVPIAGFFILMFSLENLVSIIRTPAVQIGAQTQAEG